MYGFEYEDDALMLLRAMKYLHQQNPEALRDALSEFDPVDLDMACDMAFEVIGRIFSDLDVLFDESNELEVLCFSHPVFDRFLALSGELAAIRGRSNGASYLKLQDMVEYFTVGLSNSVFDLKYHFVMSSVSLEIVLSPDCYEPLQFLDSLVRLLLHVQQENEHLERLIADFNSEAAEDRTEQDKKEVA